MVPIGYDMSMVGTIPGEAEDMAALDPLWDAAIKHRDSFPPEAKGTYDEVADKDRDVWGGTFANADPEYTKAQAEVMRISDERDRLHRSYFRLNIWGMARYRDVMELVGMGHWSDQPEWPNDADYTFPSNEHRWAAQEVLDEGDGDLTYDHGYENVVMTQELLDEAARYRKAADAVLSAHPGETPGIPLHKFCSNDGWIVTPSECSGALQIFGEWLTADQACLSWDKALNHFRKADDVERTLIVANTALRHQMQPVKVGHPDLGGEDDNRATQLDVLAEPYFLQWLQFLTDGVHSGGFTVS